MTWYRQLGTIAQKYGMANDSQWWPVAAFYVASVAVACVGYFAIFTWYVPYDDEGYNLVALLNFLDTGQLYDQVYSQYGPFFFQYFGGIFSLFGLEIHQDTGRLITLVVWVATSLLCGVGIYHLTRRLVIGVSVQMLVFISLLITNNEPMHPGALTALILAFIFATITLILPKRMSLALFLIGAAIAAEALVKLNIGLFAFVSISVVAVITLPSLSRIRALQVVVIVGFLAIPFVLMASDLAVRWVQIYALHVFMASLALVIATVGVFKAPVTKSHTTHVFWLLFGVFVLLAGIGGLTLSQGTSLAGLIDGVVLEPLGHPGIISIPLTLPSGILDWGLVSVGAAAVYRWNRTRTTRPAGNLITSATVRLIAGVVIWFTVVGEGLLGLPFIGGSPLGLSLTLAWIAAVPVRDEAGSIQVNFVRVALPALAIMQALHAYPVAGSQVGWSSFLLITVGAVCIADGLIELRKWTEARNRNGLTVRRLRNLFYAILMAKVIAIALVIPGQNYVEAYRSGVPLDLPGGKRFRLPPGQVDIYRGLVGAIKKRCSTFITLPGLNGLYFFSKKDPPTGLNASEWMLLFDAEKQQRVVDDVRGIKNLCVVRNKKVLENWLQNRPLPERPLANYINSEFEPIETYGEFELMVRKSNVK